MNPVVNPWVSLYFFFCLSLQALQHPRGSRGNDGDEVDARGSKRVAAESIEGTSVSSDDDDDSGGDSDDESVCEEPDPDETSPLASYNDIVSIHFFKIDLRSKENGQYVVYRQNDGRVPGNVYIRDLDELRVGMEKYRPDKTTQGSGTIIDDLIYIKFDAKYVRGDRQPALECGCWMNLVKDGLYCHLKEYVSDVETIDAYRRKGPVEQEAFNRLREIILDRDTVISRAKSLSERLKLMGFQEYDTPWNGESLL